MFEGRLPIVSLKLSNRQTKKMLSLRIDDCYPEVKAFVELKGYGGFAVRETVQGENEHWHWLIEVPEGVKIAAVRTALNRAVPGLKGNGKYSLTDVRDVDKYERYMCKGESEGVACEVTWRNSMKYNDDKIEELHNAYWAENRKLRKRKSGSVIDHVVDECKRQEVVWHRRSKIAEIYIKYLADSGRPISLFNVRAGVNTVQCALCPDDQAVQNLVGYCENYS